MLVVVTVWKIVNFVGPILPVLVVVYQVLQFNVPFLNATCPEMFPEEASRPEDAGVKSVQLSAGPAGVEPAEFSTLWTIVVSRVLLNILKFKQLYVWFYKNVSCKINIIENAIKICTTNLPKGFDQTTV